MKANSSTKTIRVLFTISTLFLLFAGCGKDSGGNGIEMELIETNTELPAKIRLFFRVDLGENELFTTLSQSDFEIYEDNSLISTLESQAQIQNESGDYLYSSVLLLDLSASVLQSTELPRVKDAAVSFVENVMPDTDEEGYGSREMAVFWFDGEADIHVLEPFNTNRDDIISAIYGVDENISIDASTNLNGAVIQGLTVLEARLSEMTLDPNLSTAGSMVIFTDGTDQAGREPASAALSAIRSLNSQYSVFTIGLGDEIDETMLRNFGPDGFELAPNSFGLNAAFLEVAKRVESAAGSFYVLEYCSPKRSGEHTIKLRALFENRVGTFSTKFRADGFTGGCVIQ
jgi:hypothetical protein